MSDIVELLRRDGLHNGERNRAADEIECLRAEVAAMREDAERWKYMRDNATFRGRNGPGLYWYLPRFLSGGTAEQLTAAVDAALAARKGTTPDSP